jgi:hypothetical protein
LQAKQAAWNMRRTEGRQETRRLGLWKEKFKGERIGGAEARGSINTKRGTAQVASEARKVFAIEIVTSDESGNPIWQVLISTSFCRSGHVHYCPLYRIL